MCCTFKNYLLTFEGYTQLHIYSSQSSIQFKSEMRACSLQLFALKVHLALFSTGSLRFKKKYNSIKNDLMGELYVLWCAYKVVTLTFANKIRVWILVLVVIAFRSTMKIEVIYT